MKCLIGILICTLVLCSCSGGTVQPIVIDLSKPTETPTSTAPTPTPTAPPPPAPTQAPQPTAPPEPPPAPTPETTRATAAPPAPVAAAAARPEETVEGQLAAFNRHDLDGFLGFFAPDAVVYDFPDRVRAKGIGEIRVRYGREFSEAPSARATLVRRIVQGDLVIEQQDVAGLAAGGISSITTISEVRAGKIRRMWLVRS